MAYEQFALSDPSVADQNQWAGGAGGEAVDHASNGFSLSNVCMVEIATATAIEDAIQGRFGCWFILIVMDSYVPSEFSERVADGTTNATRRSGNEDCWTIRGFRQSVLRRRC
jgi:hypothetical protein